MEPGAGDNGTAVWDGLNDDGLPVVPGVVETQPISLYY